MIKFTVESVVINQRSGNMKNGKAFPREQIVWAHTLDQAGKPKPHPTEAKLTLWDEDQPLPPGQYTLAPQSIYIDKYGAFALAPKPAPLAASGRGGA